MKKKLPFILSAIVASFAFAFSAQAFVSPYPVSYTQWAPGNTITSAWLNTIEQMIGTGSTSTSLTQQIVAISSGTSTTLGQIASQATTTGNLLVASSSSGWNVLAIGPNGYCPQASSGAPLGITWAICGGSINGTLSQAYILNASGTGLSVIQNGATTTFQINPAAYLQPSNNLSELANATTSRTNLGLGSSAIHPTTDYLSSSTQYVASVNNATGSYQIVAGSNVTISTTTTSTVINASLTSGCTPGGTTTDIQYNSNGGCSATSSLAYVTSSALFFVGSNIVSTGTSPGLSVTGSASSVQFLFTGATSSWVVPTGVTSITVGVVGAGQGNNSFGGIATGTLTVTPGTTYYYCVGQTAQTNASAFCGGGASGGASGVGGAGMTWFGTAPAFSTSSAVLVGGGSGGTGFGGTPFGGNGGYPSGATGTGGGTGGSQTAGGTGQGGAGNGSAGQGGAGTSGGDSGGGGGGGGYFGGGGAAATNPGGGGSSYFLSTLTATSSATSTTSTASLFISFTPTSTISGNNIAGKVTAGPNGVTGATLTFASPHPTSSPSCPIEFDNATNTYFETVTSSTLALTFQNVLSSGQAFNYLCIGF